MTKIVTKLNVKKLTSESKKDYLLATLTDVNGKAIKGVDIGFADNGVKYITTDEGGKARYFPNKKEAGIYNFKVAFFGNDKYEASEKVPFKYLKGKAISNSNIFKVAKDFREYVENYHKLPNRYVYDNVEFITPYMQYFLHYAVANLKSDCVVPDTVKWCSNASGDKISENIYTSDYIDMAKRVVQYIQKNGQVPNYVTSVKSKKKIEIDLSSYCMAKILVFYANNKKLPNYCTYDSTYKNKSNPAPSTPKSYSQEILEYFESKFGKVTTIDGALAKIKGRGYGYYYDDVYSNRTSIDRMKNGQGVNCTDSCHVFWHIAKALGYEVRCIHVKCRGGDGHVKLQFKNSKYPDWFERDPAAVLDGECTGCVWCSNGTILAYNPQWFLNNVNR